MEITSDNGVFNLIEDLLIPLEPSVWTMVQREEEYLKWLDWEDAIKPPWATWNYE